MTEQFSYKITWTRSNHKKNGVMKEQTIYEALKAKLNREPTNEELTADVLRILYTPCDIKITKTRG
jgi:hypothetical protein